MRISLHCWSIVHVKALFRWPMWTRIGVFLVQVCKQSAWPVIYDWCFCLPANQSDFYKRLADPFSTGCIRRQALRYSFHFNEVAYTPPKARVCGVPYAVVPPGVYSHAWYEQAAETRLESQFSLVLGGMTIGCLLSPVGLRGFALWNADDSLQATLWDRKSVV